MIGTSRTSPPNESPSSTSSASSPQNFQQSSSNGAPVIDFNAELTKHLTLKKQKKQQQNQGSPTASDSNSRANRGPPPQPPIKNASISVTDNNSTKPNSSHIHKQQTR